MSLFSMSWLEAAAATLGILTYVSMWCVAVDHFQTRHGRGAVIEAEKATSVAVVQQRPTPIALPAPSTPSPV